MVRCAFALIFKPVVPLRGRSAFVRKGRLRAMISDPGSTSSVFPPTGAELSQRREQHYSSSQSTTPRFVWGAGIECSFIPHLKVDQFEWTQHDRFWKEDFKRAKNDLGLSALRYALPWHKIETEPGKFDWSVADDRIGYAKDLGLDLYM